MATGRAFTVTDEQIRKYEVANRPRRKSLRRNGMGVVAMMGISNGRGAYSRFSRSRKGKAKKGGIECLTSPPKKYRKLGARKSSDYALPKCFRFPLHDAKHVRAALTKYGTHKARYSPEVRRTIEKNIAKAAKRFGIESPVAMKYRKKFKLNGEDSMLFTSNKSRKGRKGRKPKSFRAVLASLTGGRIRATLKANKRKAKKGKGKRKAMRRVATGVRRVRISVTGRKKKNRRLSVFAANRRRRMRRNAWGEGSEPGWGRGEDATSSYYDSDLSGGKQYGPGRAQAKAARKRAAAEYLRSSGLTKKEVAKLYKSIEAGKKRAASQAQRAIRDKLREKLISAGVTPSMFREAGISVDRLASLFRGAVASERSAQRSAAAAARKAAVQNLIQTMRSEGLKVGQITKAMKAMEAESKKQAAKAEKERVSALAQRLAVEGYKKSEIQSALRKLGQKGSRGVKMAANGRKKTAKGKTRKARKGKGRRRQTAKQRAASLRNLKKARSARKGRKGGRKAAKRRVAKKSGSRKGRKGGRKAAKSRKVGKGRRKVSAKQRAAARRNIKKAQAALRSKGRKGSKRSARKASKGRKKGMKRNGRRVLRRYRRNASFAALKAILPTAGKVFAGFVVHKFLTKLVSGFVGSYLPAGFRSTITGAGVAALGYFLADKFLPAHATLLTYGMGASLGHDVIRELVPGIGATLGLGQADVSLLPRYTLGNYYQAAAGMPYVQAAAGEYFQAAAGGMGEYFSEGGSIAQLKGAGEYFVNDLTVQGTSDYEITNNYGTSGMGAVYEGVLPESNLNNEFAMMEAAAGLGAMPNRPSPTSQSIYIPTENALTVGQGSTATDSGIFDMGGGNGILG